MGVPYWGMDHVDHELEKKPILQLRWMDRDMAARYDAILPEAGGVEHLRAVRIQSRKHSSESARTIGGTFLDAEDIERFKKLFNLLGDDVATKAMLMDYLTFAQMKHDVASR